jgi:hypothetical protein
MKSDIIDKISKLDSNIIETDAYIIGLNESNIRIHIQNYNIDTDLNIVSHKLDHIITITENNNKISIDSKENSNIINLHIGQLIKIIMVITIKDTQKIKVKLLEPNIQDLFNTSYDEFWF